MYAAILIMFSEEEEGNGLNLGFLKVDKILL